MVTSVITLFCHSGTSSLVARGRTQNQPGDAHSLGRGRGTQATREQGGRECHSVLGDDGERRPEECGKHDSNRRRTLV